MSLLRWKDEYLTGVEEIDEQAIDTVFDDFLHGPGA